MSHPISPPPLAHGDRASLPAYLSNGVVGLRVRDNPLVAGMTLVSGYAGEHPVRRIEAAAVAPYPLAGDLAVAGQWMSDAIQEARLVEQAYDFATAELTSRLTFSARDQAIALEIVTFCSRDHPTLVCQEVTIEANAACDLRFRALVDIRSIEGRAVRHDRQKLLVKRNRRATAPCSGRAPAACRGWASPSPRNSSGSEPPPIGPRWTARA